MTTKAINHRFLHLFGGPKPLPPSPTLSALIGAARSAGNGSAVFLEQLFRCPQQQQQSVVDGSAPSVAKHCLSYGAAFAAADRIAERVLGGGAACDTLHQHSRLIAILELRVPLHIILCELAMLTHGIIFCPINPDDSAQRREALRGALLGAEVMKGATVLTINDEMVRAWLSDDGEEEEDRKHTRDGAAALSDDAIAYFIFTSGTTGGAPKAVKVLRRQIALYGRCFGRRFIESGGGGDAGSDRGLPPPPRVLYASAITFDPSIGDILIALTYLGKIVCSGGQLLPSAVIEANTECSGAMGSIKAPSLAALIPAVDKWAATAAITADISLLVEHSGFTHLTSTPVVVGSIADSVREKLMARIDTMPAPTVCLGGEPMQPSLALKWSPAVRLFNIYGVTEAVIYQNATLLAYADRGAFPSMVRTLGAPLDPSSCWCAMDFEGFEEANAEGGGGREQRLVGELILLGPMLAEGYQRPSEAFFTYTMADEGGVCTSVPAYRTGDVMSYAAGDDGGGGEGTCTFVGRKDFQVKVNGKRTSLEEVEALIKSVIAKGKGFTPPVPVGADASADGQMGSSYFSAVDQWIASDEAVGQKRPLKSDVSPSPSAASAQQQPIPLVVKACTVAAVPKSSLHASPPSAADGASDDKVLVCYLCVECPAFAPATLSPDNILLTSRVVRAVLASSGLLASHMVPLYTVVEAVPAGAGVGAASSSGNAPLTTKSGRKVGGTLFMTPNGKTDRVGLGKHTVAAIAAALAAAASSPGTAHDDGGDGPRTAEQLVDELCAAIPLGADDGRAEAAVAAKRTVAAVVATWEAVLGVGLALDPSTGFAESGGDSLQAARFMGRLSRRLAAEGLLGLTAEAAAALEGGQLPSGFEAAHLLSEGSGTIAGIASLAVRAVLASAGGSPMVDGVAPSPVYEPTATSQSSARAAVMALATAKSPHAALLLQCAREGEHLLTDWVLSHGLVSLRGRMDTRGATITVLHSAARKGDLAMCGLLMHHGARVTDVNAERSTPVFTAVEAGRLAVLDMFVRRTSVGGSQGCSVSNGLQFVRDGRSQSLLHAAARATGDSADVVGYCLNTLHLDPETRDRWQRTPLHWAIINGNGAAVEAIVAYFEAHGNSNPSKQQPKFSNKHMPSTKEDWARLASKGTSKPYQTPLELLRELGVQSGLFSDALAARIDRLPFV